MLAKTILPLLGLLGLGLAVPLIEASGSSEAPTNHLNKRGNGIKFAEWGVGANWQIHAGPPFATFDSGNYLVFQGDGNLVMYSAGNTAL